MIKKKLFKTDSNITCKHKLRGKSFLKYIFLNQLTGFKFKSNFNVMEAKFVIAIRGGCSQMF